MEAHRNDSSAQVRRDLAALLERRSKDVEAAIVAHYRSSELGKDLDAETAASLPLIVGEVVKIVRKRLEEGDTWTAELPPLLAASIQHMARIGMSLDEVVRSYTVTGAALVEFIVANLGELDRPEEAMRYLMSLRGANDDRMMAAFAAEYEAELERLAAAPTKRLAERVASLLDGGSGLTKWRGPGSALRANSPSRSWSARSTPARTGSRSPPASRGGASRCGGGPTGKLGRRPP